MKISESVAGFIKTLQDSGEDLFPYLANKGKNFDSSVDTVYYSGPFWDTEEVQIAIETLLKGKWLTSGENVNKFERRFS